MCTLLLDTKGLYVAFENGPTWNRLSSHSIWTPCLTVKNYFCTEQAQSQDLKKGGGVLNKTRHTTQIPWLRAYIFFLSTRKRVSYSTRLNYWFFYFLLLKKWTLVGWGWGLAPPPLRLRACWTRCHPFPNKAMITHSCSNYFSENHSNSIKCHWKKEMEIGAKWGQSLAPSTHPIHGIYKSNYIWPQHYAPTRPQHFPQLSLSACRDQTILSDDKIGILPHKKVGILPYNKYGKYCLITDLTVLQYNSLDNTT